MANIPSTDDSTQFGLMQPDPDGPAPLEDDPLMNFFQEMVAALAALPGGRVRPRWQAQMPNLPGNDVSWVAIGIARRTGDFLPYVKHFPDNEGYSELHRHEELDLLCEFYGPSADRYAAQVRDGLGIGQNRDALYMNGMGLIEITEAVAVPIQINNIWYYRVDTTIRIRREIARTYMILNLLGFDGEIRTVVLNIKVEV